jgi:SSS family solute:Na+ symporter
MLGLFLLGLISRRANNPAAVTGVVVGVLVIVWMTVSLFPALWPETLQPLRSPLHSFMIIVVGTLTILLVGLVISSFGSRTRS